MNSGLPEGSGILRFVASVRGTTRRTHLTVALLVTAALALAVALVPTPAELGSHLLNDQDGGRARTWLEQALAESGPRPEIALPLIKVYRDQGEPGRALQLLDRVEPQLSKAAIATHRALAASLRYEALRDAGHGLEATLALGTADLDALPAPRLHELQRLYAERGLHELQLDVLAALQRRAPADAALRCARAQALVRLGRLDAALALLEDVWRRAPTALRPHDAEQLLRLRARLDPSERLLDLAEALLALQPALGDRVDVARRLLAEARPATAKALLAPLLASAAVDDDTLLAWVQAEVQLGHVDDAIAELRARLVAGAGPAGATAAALSGRAATLVLRAALEAGRGERALELAAGIELAPIDRAVLLWLAEVADGAGNLVSLRRLVIAIDQRADRGRPATVARLCWAAGEAARARRWLARARAAGAAEGVSHRDLAALALAMNDREATREQLAAWVGALDIEREALVDLAGAFWRLGAPAQGLQLLDGACDRARRSGSARCRAAHLLLLAAGGRLDEAHARFEGTLPAALRRELRGLLARQAGDAEGSAAEAPTGRAPDQQVRDWLRAVATLAVEGGHAPLVRAAYQALAGAVPGDRAVQLALARAHLEAHAYDEALRVLRGVRPADAESEALQRHALLAAYRRSRSHRDALVQAAVAYVAAHDLRDAETQSWVHVLLDVGAAAEALPFVQRLARRLGGGWADRHVALLRAAGDPAELRDALLARAQAEDQPLAQRLAAIDALHAAGERALALRLLLAAAADAAPDSPALLRLLALAGPRPGAAVQQLLTRRAEASAGPARVAFARHLLWIGAGREVVRLLESDSGPAARALVIDALVAGRAFAALARWSDRELPTLADPELVRRLAQLHLGHGERAAALRAFERLHALAPRDPLALRQLALAAAGRPAEAERRWQAWLALPPAERGAAGWRDHLALAEALAAQTGRDAEARTHLQVALRLLDAAGDAGGDDRDRVAGMLLARLQRPLDAASRLRTALARAPCDDALRADLVAALMAARRLEEADAVVDPPAQCRPAPVAAGVP